MISYCQLAGNYSVKISKHGMSQLCTACVPQQTGVRPCLSCRPAGKGTSLSMCSLCCLVILYISALAAILASCVICRHQVGSVCCWWWPGNRANSSEGLEDEGECTRTNTRPALLDWYIFTCCSFHLSYCWICSIDAKCSYQSFQMLHVSYG